jgi:hypothetical protein
MSAVGKTPVTVVEVIRDGVSLFFFCNRLSPSPLGPTQIVAACPAEYATQMQSILASGQVQGHEFDDRDINLMLIKMNTYPNSAVTPFPNLAQFRERFSVNHLTIRMITHREQGKSFLVDSQSAQCLYIQTGDNQYERLVADTVYLQQVSIQIRVVSCNGLIPVSMLTRGTDYTLADTDMGQIFSLNPSRIIRMSFRLSRASTDRDKKVVVWVPPNFQMSVPVTNDANSIFACVYEPIGVVERFTEWTIVSSYQTDSLKAAFKPDVNIKVSHVNPAQPDYLFEIDVLKINMELLQTMENVHIHGNLNLAHCPLETVVAARFKTPENLSEFVCAMLDNLNRDSRVADLFRLPYLYTLNVANGTCVKQKINHEQINRLPNETALTYLDDDLYDQLITPEVEMMLMKNIMFQMAFTYGKFGDNFMSCPQHSMVIDYYVRRAHSQVGFHYDLTANFQVSSLSLLFSMPDGMVRPGPMIAPVHYGAKVAPSTTVSTFNVARHVCVIVNNSAVTHSTPDMEALSRRGQKYIPFEFTRTKESFDFPEMWVSDEFSHHMEQTKLVPRSFLRLWHVVYVGDEAQSNLGRMEPMFQAEFPGFVSDVMQIQQEWFRANPCTCINVGGVADIHPTTLSDALKTHKVKGQMGGRQSRAESGLFQRSNKSKTYASVGLTKMSRVSPKRASTMSSIKEKIRVRMNQYKSIFSNPNKNVVIYLPKKSRHIPATRKRAASMGQLRSKQHSSTHRRKTRSAP